MADYVLSCCTMCDLNRAWLENRDIRYTYFNYEINGSTCKDDFGETISPADLYARMLAGAEVKTSQVSVGEYMNDWRPILEEGKDILHVCLASGLSGTYASACMARDSIMREFPERKVIVIDSTSGSSGYGLLMDRLADLRDEGYSLEDLAAWAESHKIEINTWFVTTDLTFLIRGGRVSKAAGLLGGMLNICPMLDIEPDGTLAVKEKIRTKRKAFARQLQKMEDLAQGGFDYDQRVFIANTECLADAKAVASMIEGRFHKIRDNKVEIFDVGAGIGCHLGPGTVVLSFWGAPRG
jgi:DegV family protein with EDD domain